MFKFFTLNLYFQKINIITNIGLKKDLYINFLYMNFFITYIGATQQLYLVVTCDKFKEKFQAHLFLKKNTIK